MKLRSTEPLIATSALTREFGWIVHSHLRWDFVWQRPQQLFSRFAANNPVLFVEEPLYFDGAGEARLECTEPCRNVRRCVPRLPCGSGGYDASILIVRGLLKTELARLAERGHFRRPIQWFYTPMPAPAMLGAFGEDGVVYDCMDELSQFRFAPRELREREAELLSAADVVFTGGRRLYESKRKLHGSVHYFGCGVDVAHFAVARAAATVVPPEIAALRKPILGYFGVIDERLDYELLGRIATQRPEWTLAMIGPVVKVDPQELPRAPNIAWLGQRDYADLPRLLKAFDVCLMPFALNEATEYINPTKTLEYMASGKPIVSTRIADVVRSYSSIVRIAHDAEEFIAESDRAMSRTSDPRLARGMALAAESSWESIVAAMGSIVARGIDVGAEDAKQEYTVRDTVAVNGTSDRGPMTK